MGISRLFLKEIIEMCNFLSDFKIVEEKKNLNIIFLGDQDIRVNSNQINKYQKFNKKFKVKNKINSGREKARLKDLFPRNLQSLLNIKTIDINGSPDLKLDITNTEKISNSSLEKNSISHFVDIGTIEHVIDPHKALCNISNLIKIGGFISHLSPCSSYLNHGYYLISPQLLNDFYKNQNYKILRFRTLSYFGNYDKIFSICFNLEYHHDLEILGIKALIKKKKYLIALNSFFRRILVRLSRETYVSFTAKKISNKECQEKLIYQKQYKKNRIKN